MARDNELINTVLDIGRKCLLQSQDISVGADISQRDFVFIDVLEVGQKLSCNELAGKVGLSVSRSSRIVDGLVRSGYVVRRVNPDDRRAVHVSLSPKGVKLKKNVEKLKRECETRIFGAIAPEKLEIVRQGMWILQQSLREDR